MARNKIVQFEAYQDWVYVTTLSAGTMIKVEK